MTPYEQGRQAFLDGKGLQDAPWPKGTPDGDTWRNGFLHAVDEAENADTPKATVLEVLPVCLKAQDGRLVLTDDSGRAIGTQVEIYAHQSSEDKAGYAGVTVTLAGVPLKTE